MWLPQEWPAFPTGTSCISSCNQPTWCSVSLMDKRLQYNGKQCKTKLFFFFLNGYSVANNWANVHMKQAKLPLPLRYFQCHYTCFVWLSVPKLGHPHRSPSPISLSSDFTEHYYYTHTVVCSLAPLCLLPHTSAVLLCQLLYIIRLRLVSNKGLYSFVYSAMCLK